MVGEHHALQLLPIITLLAAAVIAAPLSKRLGFGAVLGYLAAGIVIGPFGLQLFNDPSSILQVAELGVVMLLFLIGLEMRPSLLWSLRRQIFGLGLLQVVVCALLLTGVGVVSGFPVGLSFVAGAGFVLTSTAIVMQLLEERGELGSSSGQSITSILLLEDLMIVPLLAIVTFMAPVSLDKPASEAGIAWGAIAIGVGSIATLIVVGRYLINPLFGILAKARSREVMTAAALLVVLGSAYGIQMGGLSMAMGAFLAGVLLSESTYRHQLEVDIEPFRGILLGLFFIAVGMSLELKLVREHWQLVLGYVLAYMSLKALAIYLVARLFRSSNREALNRSVLMAQGGEFAFILYSVAATVGIINSTQNALLTAIVIVSMALTPIVIAALKVVFPDRGHSTAGYKQATGLSGSALIIGFGRVGQIASQFLFARDYEVSIIDTDVEMIDVATKLHFKVYFGDGTRLDTLRAAGAGECRVVLVCVDRAEDATRITSLLKTDFPLVPVLVRAKDRIHSMELLREGADFQVRETFESALTLGRAALEQLGVERSEVDEISDKIRERDQQRLELEIVGGIDAGRALFSGESAQPTHTNQK